MSPLSRICLRSVSVVTGLVMVSCAGGGGDAPPEAASSASNTVEVTAVQDGDRHRFILSRDTVSQGWTTFRFVNSAPVTHFALVSRLPAGYGVDDYRNQLAEVAQNMVDQALLNREPTFPDAGSELPGWYADVQVMGGPGLTSPGRTSEVTMDLTPGTYVLECYVKTPEGYFHHILGMLSELTVRETAAETSEPEATVDLTLTNSGIEAPDSLAPGARTVAVHFAEQQQYANLGRNDVHLARLSEDTDLEDLSAWMNAMNQEGLVAPSGPAQFLGGVQEMPAGATAYLAVDLTPGRYAWVSEVPDPMDKGMLRTFAVPPGGGQD